MGWAGYPALRLMTLAETGTRALLGAAIGSAADRDEAGLARRLLPLLRPGMLLLLDRGFDADAFLAEVDATGRCCGPGPSPPATRRCWSTCLTVPTCHAWTAWRCGSSRRT